MNSMITSDLSISFKEWARRVNDQQSDILTHMRKSTDPLDRVIAKRIMETAREIKT